MSGRIVAQFQRPPFGRARRFENTIGVLCHDLYDSQTGMKGGRERTLGVYLLVAICLLSSAVVVEHKGLTWHGSPEMNEVSLYLKRNWTLLYVDSQLFRFARDYARDGQNRSWSRSCERSWG